MNNSELQPCPLCETALDLHGPIYSNAKDLLNDVYVCRRCGLVYKPILNFSDEFNTDNLYTVASWKSENKTHLQRMKNIVDMVEQRFLIDSNATILDVGAGIGLLYEAISSKKTVKKYVALEPVTGIAAHLKKTHPEVFVLNSSIDRVTIPESLFDLVFVLGVDYLFQDIDSAFKKIRRSLKPDGHVVVQRNVFIDQTALIGPEMKNMEDMFGANLLMRNWFHSSQYSEFLNKHFMVDEIVKEEFEFQSDSERPYKGYQLTYFCRPRNADAELNKQQMQSYFDTNIAILDRLQQSQAEKTTEPLSVPVAEKSLLQSLRFW